MAGLKVKPNSFNSCSAVMISSEEQHSSASKQAASSGFKGIYLFSLQKPEIGVSECPYGGGKRKRNHPLC